jgi:hypothetical protein
MEMKNPKAMAIGLAAFSVVNIIWLYLYTLVGIKFSDAMDPKILFKFAGPNGPMMILLLLGVGFLIALSIFLVRLFSRDLSTIERLVMIAAGVAISIGVGSVLYSNLIVFVIMMAFFMLGCMMIAEPESVSGFFSKLGAGNGATKRVMLMLTIGSLVASLIFVSMNTDDAKIKTKDAISSLMSNLNFSSMLSNIVPGGVMSQDQIREMLINQTMNNLGFTRDQVLNDPTLMTSIDGNASQIYQSQAQQIGRLTNTSGTMQPIIENLLDNPPFSYFFDFLPIIIAVAVASVVSLFGAVWVSPMGALLGLAMPARPEAKKK